AMGRKLGINVRLTRAFRPQFNQVVIALTERNQANALNQFATTAECLRVQADALDKHVNPLIGGKILAAFDKRIVIQAGKLYRLERTEYPGGGLPILVKLILDIADTPHPSYQQLRVFFNGA